MMAPSLSLLALPVFRRLLLSAGIAALVLVVAGTLAVGAAWSRAESAQLALDGAYASLADAQALEGRLALTHASEPGARARYHELAEAGLFDPARRAYWAEQAAGRARRLAPLAFDVEIAPPAPATLPPDAQRWFDETGAPAPLLHTHDLQLRIQGLHEAELARLVEDIGHPAEGLSRLQECELARRADGIGVDGRCVLRFVTLAWPESGP